MKIDFIHEQLKYMSKFKWGSVYVPEFTFNDRRIDAIIIDIPHRWVRGFEIKMNKADFQRDNKWRLYTEFCSSLSIVCPAGIIEPEEIIKPYGLLWIKENWPHCEWKKRPKNFNRRDSLAWIWTYLRVLEKEIPRFA